MQRIFFTKENQSQYSDYRANAPYMYVCPMREHVNNFKPE